MGKLQSQAANHAAKAESGDLAQYIRLQREKIQAVLPEGIDTDAYLDKITMILSSDKDFLSGNFSSKSFINGLIKCALGGLYPNTGQGEAYLTVGKDGNVKFMLGLGGHLKWATKAGLRVRRGHICENDEAKLTRSDDGIDFYVNEKIIGRGKIIAYYASYVNIKHPEDRDVIIISKNAIEEHQKKVAGNSLTWKTHFDAMAENYCIKQLLKHHQYNVYEDSNDVERVTSVLNSDDCADIASEAELNELKEFENNVNEAVPVADLTLDEGEETEENAV